MWVLVIVLRIVSLLAFAAPMLLRRGPAGAQTRQSGARAPLVANIAAVALFLPLLFVFSGSSESSTALPLAALGSLFAIAGATLVVRSRVELGSAWSFAPKADQESGLVTTGPYAVVRHPIYLGLTLVAAGQAIAFGSWPALLVVVFAIVPTFAWRARAEEQLLGDIFEQHTAYRRRTKLFIPYLL
jgi:protein-S-isoprenylcysteine O-methyltransferase Ste14